MHDSTTVRVSTTTRDALRLLATDDGITMDEEIKRLTRAERQRRIGTALATSPVDRHDQTWLDMSADTARGDAPR